MKNKLTDLNDHLFAQLERLTDEKLEGEQLALEVERTRAMVDVADRVVANARVMLEAAQLVAQHGDKIKMPLLGAGSNGRSNGSSNGAATA